ncbi:MAG: protein BatD, partial [Deltaproteobacteria bacterium]|nr:protein BatD [Deltaproteobacteria bacterium]
MAPLILVAFASTGSARAEAPKFNAEVDRNQIAAGESFIYEVTLSVGNDTVSDYRPPDFKGMRVLSTPAAPNQSTQMQFGGAGMFVQVSYAWRYEVAATQKGPMKIGPARVRVNGQEFRSNVVTVTASASASGVSPPPLAGALPGATSSGTPGVDPGAAPPQAGQSAGGDGGSFIRLVTDKQKAFVGEAISATWYLYMNQPADKYDTQVEPHTEGFWTEDVVVPSRRGGLVLTQEMVQGRSYQVGTVLKKALFPLHAGRLTITPMEAEISRSDFFGNAVRSQRLRATPTDIEVSPLPKTGQPSGFDAANIGTFTLNARVDRPQVAVGEAVTLTIEIAGRGNLRKVGLPKIPKLDGWKAYEPRVNVVVDPATGVSGTKTAEILLLPERSGAVTLPALGLDVFDPEARRYTRVDTAPIALTATGDTPRAATLGAPGGGAGSSAARGAPG